METIVKNTVLTAPLQAWLESAADSGRVLRAIQDGADVRLEATICSGGHRVRLSATETLEIQAILAAHAVEPLESPPSSI